MGSGEGHRRIGPERHATQLTADPIEEDEAFSAAIGDAQSEPRIAFVGAHPRLKTVRASNPFLSSMRQSAEAHKSKCQITSE